MEVILKLVVYAESELMIHFYTISDIINFQTKIFGPQMFSSQCAYSKPYINANLSRQI